MTNEKKEKEQRERERERKRDIQVLRDIQVRNNKTIIFVKC